MSEPKSLLGILRDTKLSSVIPAQQQVTVLEHNQTVGEALRVLAKHKILSAPIVVSAGLEDVENMVPGESAPSLLGWLDVLDVVTCFLAFLREHKKELPTAMLALMAELDKYGPQFISKMLITVVGGDDKGLMYQADTDVTVLQAVRSSFLGSAGTHKAVHRLAIFDAHGDITHIVSQMDVLRYLLTLVEQLPDLAGRPIRDFGWVGRQHLVTLSATTPTLLAFQQLAAAGVLGAPVVSPEGRLVANLSVSDVRCIQPGHLSVLGLPVAEFLALNHGTAYLGYSQRSSRAAEHPFFAGGPRSSSSNGSRGMLPPSPRASGGPVGAARAAAAAMMMAGSDMEEDGEGADEGVPLICVEPTATFGEVVKLLVVRHVHRVYVRDKGAQPCEVVGIITPTDILKVVDSLCKDEEAAVEAVDAAAGGSGVPPSPSGIPRKRQCTQADHPQGEEP